MRWWCFAQGAPWTWTWQPYFGVWLLVLSLALVYARWYRRAGSQAMWRKACARGGLLLLWLLLDWPIGALGAGYLESVHALQFLGLAFAVPLLLVLGLPAGWETRLGTRTRARLEAATHPLVTIIGFNVMVFATHLPPLVDLLMASQVGSVALDLAWLVGGLLFWWPVVRAWPGRRLAAAAQLAYLLGATTPHMAVGMFFVVAQVPVYRVYELAPRIGGSDPLDDQGRAGGIMMAGDVALGLSAIAVLLYRWRREESERLAAGAA